MKYYAIVLQPADYIDTGFRVIAPFMSEKEAETERDNLMSQELINDYVSYIVCTEVPSMYHD